MCRIVLLGWLVGGGCIDVSGEGGGSNVFGVGVWKGGA